MDLLSLNENDFAEEDESDENRLLPAMHKLWPYFIISLKNKISVAVVKKCTKVINKSVQISGGDFFIRRFHTDGTSIWKLLTISPFHRNPNPSSSTNSLILLSYRANPLAGAPVSEISSQKVQAAVLDMIPDLSSDKRSRIALESVLKWVTGLVVGIAVSPITGLRENAIRALSGLMNIDEDLVWLLVADVYYSPNSNENDLPRKSCGDWYGMDELVPVPKDSKEFLYFQFGKESFGFDLDPLGVDVVFKWIQEGLRK